MTDPDSSRLPKGFIDTGDPEFWKSFPARGVRRPVHEDPAMTTPLTSSEIDDLAESRRKGLFLPPEVRTDLIDRLLVTVDEANKRTLALAGARFGPCICEYSRPSLVMVGCPVHYPDPGADAEGETA